MSDYPQAVKLSRANVTIECEGCGEMGIFNFTLVKSLRALVDKIEEEEWVFDGWKSNTENGEGWFCPACVETENG